MARIAINGFGRIGRNVLRAALERERFAHEIVAINDLGSAEMNAHLLKFDTVHGTLSWDVEHDESALWVGGREIRCCSERAIDDLPWRELDIDLVMECTGIFTARCEASAHLKAGAGAVVVSAPGKGVDATIVYGVNEQVLDGSQRVISNASCTTNCLAPIAKVLNENIGIESGLATTIHAFTNDQRLSDMHHSDMLRARAATQSLIPTKTGAASAVGLVLPELEGKLDGLAVRVPVINVSMLDLTFRASHGTDVAEVNASLRDASNNGLRGILDINQLPLVSSDFNHNPASSIADLSLTRVTDDLVKVMAWYDNEWGFSNRMLDTGAALLCANA